MAFTSRQLDALAQYAEAVDTFVQAFGEDYPMTTAQVETDAAILKTWAQSNPAPESPDS